MANPEHHVGGAERIHEVERSAAERAAELRETQAHHGEQLEQHTTEELENQAEKLALSKEDYRPAKEEKHGEASPPPTFVGAKEREKSYKQTMQTVQQDMSAPSRAFSKVIHNKAIEKTSDIVGSSVARPNAILTGAIFAFVFVAVLYAMARYIGFALQGSETIIAFVAGWVIGVLFDFFRVMITGKR